MSVSTHDDRWKDRLIHDVGFDRYFRADTWADYNRQFFDGLADKYDATNVLHLFGTKHAIGRAAVRRLALPPRALVLDVCCGSGDIAIEILRSHPDARVIGIDASARMLRVAEKRASRYMDRLTLVEGDALNLPFEDASFDGAIVSFGLRNLARLRDGVREMRRVLKPGGVFSNIDQGRPTGVLFPLMYEVYFRRIAPVLGKLVFHRGEFNSFRYLPESNRYFPPQGEMCDLLRECGLVDVRNHDYWCGAVSQQVAAAPGLAGGA